MSQNNIELLSIEQLLNKTFYIPNYQRGYRWTKRQVQDLLEDIRDFAAKKRNEYEFYCVQPLVVKRLSDDERKLRGIDRQEEWFEVIDGQQRLTTIFLVLLMVKDASKILGLSTDSYKLVFEREGKDENYISSLSPFTSLDDTTIDHYHLTMALDAIREWLEENGKDKAKICSALLNFELDNNNPQRDKANNVRFIWYESVDENPIEVFTRLNVGKISLTNAELIKALLLSSKNFKDVHVKLRQQEIASEWDRIEYTLQDDEFWLFMHKNGYDRPTRIDFFFDLMSDNNELELADEILERVGTDKDRTFRYFYEYFKTDNYDLDYCWGKLKYYFQTLMDWYDNVESYHYIGYLIECGSKNIKELIDDWKVYSDRNLFINQLKEYVKNILNNCPTVNFQYKEDGSNKTKAKPILLFHNIQTVINQNKRQVENDKYQQGVFYKFPFHLYKKENWDVEHINSNTTNPEEDNNIRKEWLLNWYLSVPKDIQENIKTYIMDGETDDLSFDMIKAKLPVHKEWGQDEKNKLWNYCLLDSSTNRSYMQYSRPNVEL